MFSVKERDLFVTQIQGSKNSLETFKKTIKRTVILQKLKKEELCVLLIQSNL